MRAKLRTRAGGSARLGGGDENAEGSERRRGRGAERGLRGHEVARGVERGGDIAGASRNDVSFLRGSEYHGGLRVVVRLRSTS